MESMSHETHFSIAAFAFWQGGTVVRFSRTQAAYPSTTPQRHTHRHVSVSHEHSSHRHATPNAFLLIV
jgi:hypothetical protein